MSITSTASLHLMWVTPDDVAIRVDQNGAAHLAIGARPATVNINAARGTTKEELTNLRLIAARIDELALAEINKINRAEYTALPLEDVDEGEFLDAWGITPDDLGDIVSLDAKDPGDEPIVIDVDGTEVAA